MLRQRLALALVALAAFACLPAAALADGDPASDVLLGENVFYPYSPAVSPAVQRTLDRDTAAAARAGFPIKIALIASPIDLGVIPSLFGKPQQYANFLDQEISFQKKQILLVVMAAGYGGQGMTPAATTALATLTKPSGPGTDDLARAATAAVVKLAQASGHPIGSAPTSAGGGSGFRTVLIGLTFVLAGVLGAGALVALRRRGAAAR